MSPNGLSLVTMAMKLTDVSLYQLGGCFFHSLALKEILLLKYGFKMLVYQMFLFRKDKS